MSELMDTNIEYKLDSKENRFSLEMSLIRLLPQFSNSLLKKEGVVQETSPFAMCSAELSSET